MKKFSAALVAGILTLSMAAPAIAHDSNSNKGKRDRATIAGIACTAPTTAADGFSDLCAAVTATNLGATLSGKRTLTVFAPTNLAFQNLCKALAPSAPCVLGNSAGDIVTALGTDASVKLTNVVKYHVINGRRFANSIFGRHDKNLRTLYKCTDRRAHRLTSVGSPRSARTAILKTETVGQTAHVVATVKARNGVIHVVDTVLLPGSLTCS